MTHSSLDRLAKLATAIIKRTKSGQLQWEKTSTDGVYSTVVSNYIVHIHSSQRPRISSPDYYISLYDNAGNRIEQFADTDLEENGIEGYDGFFEAMADLYRTAGQQAFGANEAIDAILRELGG